MGLIVLGIIVIATVLFLNQRKPEVEALKETATHFLHDAAPAVRTVQTAAEKAKGEYKAQRTSARLEALQAELAKMQEAEEARRNAPIVERSNRAV